MKKYLIVALATLMAVACTEAQKKSVTDVEVDAAIVLANAAFKNIDTGEDLALSMARDGEVVVLKVTKQLGDEAATLQLAGMLVGNLATEYAMSQLATIPQAVTAMDEVFSYGYDIRVEFYDVEQGLIVAAPITREDLNKYR